MEPHWFERDGDTFEVRFERGPEAWHALIRRVADGVVARIAFPDAGGYAADDVRGSLIAGCEAAAARLPEQRAEQPAEGQPERPPTRH